MQLLSQIRFIYVTIIFFLFINGCARDDSADLVIKGGKIYTVNPGNPIAAAVAVKNGRIITVGSNSIIESINHYLLIIINSR